MFTVNLTNAYIHKHTQKFLKIHLITHLIVKATSLTTRLNVIITR